MYILIEGPTAGHFCVTISLNSFTSTSVFGSLCLLLPSSECAYMPQVPSSLVDNWRNGKKCLTRMKPSNLIAFRVAREAQLMSPSSKIH